MLPQWLVITGWDCCLTSLSCLILIIDDHKDFFLNVPFSRGKMGILKRNEGSGSESYGNCGVMMLLWYRMGLFIITGCDQTKLWPFKSILPKFNNL